MTLPRALLYIALGILIVYALLRWCADVSWGNQWWVIAGVAAFMLGIVRATK
jgi:predicted membrane channel-forming protein YqfA (hemolysin III family)